MRKILFICMGNTCRSPMAAGFFNHLARAEALEWQAFSAGRDVSEAAANDKAIRAAAEHGVDLSHHVPQQLDDALVDGADLLLTMERCQKDAVAAEFSEARGKVHTLLGFIGEQGKIDDPYGLSLDVYQNRARQIMRAVQALTRKLSQTA